MTVFNREFIDDAIAQGHIAIAPPASPDAQITGAFGAAAANKTTFSEQRMLAEIYQREIEELYKRTGKRFNNPVYQTQIRSRGGQRRQPGDDPARFEGHFFERLENFFDPEFRQQLAEAGLITDFESPIPSFDELRQTAFAETRRLETEQIERRKVGESVGVIGPGAFELIGEGAAIALDPPILGTMLFGGGAAHGILRGLLIDSAIGFAVEVPVQADIQSARAAAGLDAGVLQGALNVLTATVGIAGVSGTIRAAGKGVSGLARRADERQARRIAEDVAARANSDVVDAAVYVAREGEMSSATPFARDLPQAQAQHVERFDETLAAAQEGRVAEVSPRPSRPARADAYEVNGGSDPEVRAATLELEARTNAVRAAIDARDEAFARGVDPESAEGQALFDRIDAARDARRAADAALGAVLERRRTAARSSGQATVRGAFDDPADAAAAAAIHDAGRSAHDVAAVQARAEDAPLIPRDQLERLEEFAGLDLSLEDLVAMVREARATLRRTKPETLMAFLARRGVVDEAGELSALGIRNRAKGVPVGLVRQPGRGFPIDQAAEAAHGAGFFRTVPTRRELLDALDDELNQGIPTVRDIDIEQMQMIEAADEVGREFDKLGVNIDTVNEAELADALAALSAARVPDAAGVVAARTDGAYQDEAAAAFDALSDDPAALQAEFDALERQVQDAVGFRPRAEPEPAPVQGQIVTDPQQAFRMNADQIEQLLNEKRLSDDEKLLLALGSPERVREFERLDRARNSLNNPARADAAGDEFDRLFGDLTPTQERLIFGIGDTDLQADHLARILDTRRELDALAVDGTIPQIAREASRGMRNLTVDQIEQFQARRIAPGNIQADLLSAIEGQRLLRERGLTGDELDQALIDGMVQQGFGRDDAAEILSKFSQPAPRGAGIEAPAPEQIAGRPPTEPPESVAASADSQLNLDSEVRIGDETVRVGDVFDDIERDKRLVDEFDACAGVGDIPF